MHCLFVHVAGFVVFQEDWTEGLNERIAEFRKELLRLREQANGKDAEKLMEELKAVVSWQRRSRCDTLNESSANSQKHTCSCS